MSTSGVFIIRKGGTEKGLNISHDAYPGGAGVDIVDLIKTTDIAALFDCMSVFDEWDPPEDGEYPDEPDRFSFAECRMAVKEKRTLWISPGAEDWIRDSLFCEYAYVIDLERQELQFFVGGQRHPQEGNPYGIVPQKPFGSNEDYYPCKYAAVFSLEYIRLTSAEHIAHEMERASKAKGEILRYCGEPSKEMLAGQDDFVTHKGKLAAAMTTAGEQLEKQAAELLELNITSHNRALELATAVKDISDAVAKLEKRLRILK